MNSFVVMTCAVETERITKVAWCTSSADIPPYLTRHEATVRRPFYGEGRSKGGQGSAFLPLNSGRVRVKKHRYLEHAAAHTFERFSRRSFLPFLSIVQSRAGAPSWSVRYPGNGRFDCPRSWGDFFPVKDSLDHVEGDRDEKDRQE